MSGLPEKGADLRGSRGTSGEVWGTSGKVWETSGNLWIAVKFHSERASGEVAEKLPGKFGELLGKSGDFPEALGNLTPSQRLAKFVSKKKGPECFFLDKMRTIHKTPQLFIVSFFFFFFAL